MKFKKKLKDKKRSKNFYYIIKIYINHNKIK